MSYRLFFFTLIIQLNNIHNRGNKSIWKTEKLSLICAVFGLFSHRIMINEYPTLCSLVVFSSDISFLSLFFRSIDWNRTKRDVLNDNIFQCCLDHFRINVCLFKPHSSISWKRYDAKAKIISLLLMLHHHMIVHRISRIHTQHNNHMKRENNKKEQS